MRTPFSVSRNGNETKTAALPLSAPILVVEDDADAVIVIRELISRAIAAPIDVASGAAEAIDYLQKRLETREAPMPRLVLVDSDLAESDGWQVVNWIRKTPALSGLAVMVMGPKQELGAQNESDETVLCETVDTTAWSSDAEPAPPVRRAGYLSIAQDLKGLAFA